MIWFDLYWCLLLVCLFINYIFFLFPLLTRYLSVNNCTFVPLLFLFFYLSILYNNNYFMWFMISGTFNTDALPHYCSPFWQYTYLMKIVLMPHLLNPLYQLYTLTIIQCHLCLPVQLYLFTPFVPFFFFLLISYNN